MDEAALTSVLDPQEGQYVTARDWAVGYVNLIDWWWTTEWRPHERYPEDEAFEKEVDDASKDEQDLGWSRMAFHMLETKAYSALFDRNVWYICMERPPGVGGLEESVWMR